MRKTIFNLAIVIGITLLAARPAPAFYWTLKTTPSLVNPIPPIPGTDPLPLPPDNPAPGGGPGGPGSVPEPATALASAIGMMVLGARRVLRKQLAASR
jgi:hypothetical protein